jgi:hypothetical protein
LNKTHASVVATRECYGAFHPSSRIIYITSTSIHGPGFYRRPICVRTVEFFFQFTGSSLSKVLSEYRLSLALSLEIVFIICTRQLIDIDLSTFGLSRQKHVVLSRLSFLFLRCSPEFFNGGLQPPWGSPRCFKGSPS